MPDDIHAPDTLALLQDLISRRSLTPEDAGCCALIGARLAALGFHLEWLPKNGGIILVTAVPGFLSEEARVWNARRDAEEARLKALWQGQPDAVDAGMRAWDEANPYPPAHISDMADHIDHVRKIAGIDAIGIGGDFDGIPAGPLGMEDVSTYPALFIELARRGYSQDDLEKISSRNMMRVMRGVEAASAAMADVPPYEYPASAGE